ncbi:MAG: PqqD family protein [Bacteroidaceae bacterium]|nr:PqqD family protein [Bacteroidaceae bacterium]MBP5522690.1 PqqD family protein [Bacteroidaceae bacterium]MBQ4380326.1 PqqD family protein [Bacteroidaceae bacterium]
MKIKPGFELRSICGENIVIAHGIENIDFSRVITLNASAADVWNAVVGKDFELTDVVSTLLAEYEVDEQTATADAKQLIDDWKKAGLI